MWHHVHLAFNSMSETFAHFLLENADNGNDILAVLEDIVERVDNDQTEL